MNRNSFLPLLVAAGLSTAATAQFVPVPYNADLVDGQQGVSLPFGVPGFRTQILVDAASIAPNGAALLGMRFRADRSSLPLSGGSVPNVTIDISHTNINIGNLGPTFAGNITEAPQNVFSGTVTLPAHASHHAGPMPWDITITFSQPFLFATVNGNLLIDIKANNAAGGTPSYYLDAMQRGGSATQFGASGDNPSGDFLNLIAHNGNGLEPRFITTGNAIEYSSTLSFTSPPGVLALGLLPTPGGPIDLGFAGAPNQFLHIDPIMLVAHQWQQSFIGWYTTFTLPIPNDPTWIDDTIYVQSVLLDPAANPLGIVLSHAIETRIGDGAQFVHSMQQVDAADPAATDGVVLDFGFGQPEHGAVPILLEGAFF